MYCSYCDKSGDKLPRCGRCKIVFYCGRTCQKNARYEHKIECDDACGAFDTFKAIEVLYKHLDWDGIIKLQEQGMRAAFHLHTDRYRIEACVIMFCIIAAANRSIGEFRYSLKLLEMAMVIAKRLEEPEHPIHIYIDVGICAMTYKVSGL